MGFRGRSLLFKNPQNISDVMHNMCDVIEDSACLKRYKANRCSGGAAAAASNQQQQPLKRFAPQKVVKEKHTKNLCAGWVALSVAAVFACLKLYPILFFSSYLVDREFATRNSAPSRSFPLVPQTWEPMLRCPPACKVRL